MIEKITDSRHIYSGRVVGLRVDTVQSSDGRISQREIIEHAPCIAVIAIDHDGKIILERQYRAAVEKELLEIPAGSIEPGESPENTVRREMGEETGYAPGVIEKLGQFYLAPGYSSELLHLFLARDLTPNRLMAEDTPDITLVRLTESEALDLLRQGAIQDGKSVAGLMLYFVLTGKIS